jgi:hypothetical protein
LQQSGPSTCAHSLRNMRPFLKVLGVFWVLMASLTKMKGVRVDRLFITLAALSGGSAVASCSRGFRPFIAQTRP